MKDKTGRKRLVSLLETMGRGFFPSGSVIRMLVGPIETLVAQKHQYQEIPRLIARNVAALTVNLNLSSLLTKRTLFFFASFLLGRALIQGSLLSS